MTDHPTPWLRRWWVPVAGSFAIYLVPLVGPHAIFLLGEVLYRGPARRSGAESAGWFAAELGLALALQAVVALVLAWSLRGGRVRLLVPVVLAPVLVAFVEYAYLAALPAHFLIESDERPEVSALREECVVAGASLVAVRGPAAPTRPSTVGWAQYSDGRYALVRPSSCRALDVDLPRPTVSAGGRVDFMLGPIYTTPDGVTLFERTEIGRGTRSWWVFSPDRGRLEPLSIPAGQQASPVLADDGTAIAWIESVPHPELPATARLHLRLVTSSSPDRQLDLSPLGAATYAAAGYDRAGGVLWLWRDDRFVAINEDAHVLHTIEPAQSIRPQLQTWVIGPGGTLQWDAYRDEGAYWLAWKTADGAGRSRVPLGRSITSAALDPGGRFVAVSTTTAVSIGSVRDTVDVFRTRDGSEVLRRYLPTYTRSTVGFFDGGRLAYSDAVGTHVLRLPAG